MSESEIRAELLRLLGGCGIGDALARQITERVMDMVADYAREEASEAANDAVRDYEERM